MERRRLLKTIAALPAVTSIARPAETRTWLGADFWANPLQDWRRAGNRIECVNAGGDRNVVWLVREVSAHPFQMSMRMGKISGDKGWVGFRTGMRGHFNAIAILPSAASESSRASRLTGACSSVRQRAVGRWNRSMT